MIGMPMGWQERARRDSLALMGFRNGTVQQLALVRRIEPGKWLWMARCLDRPGKLCGAARTMRHAMLAVESMLEAQGGLLMRSPTMASENRLAAELNVLGVLAAGKDSSDAGDTYRAWRSLAELREIFDRCGYEAGEHFQARHATLQSWVPTN